MIKGSYLYDLTLSLIDYCGDIKNGHTIYNQRYSPNNIRRLYISPDGSVVRYHINVGKGIQKAISYNSDALIACSSRPDYVPIIYVLSADRICASVEDVVICTGSRNGAKLDPREMDVTGLIKSYKGGGKDLKDLVMNRYKRLNSFIIYDGTLQDFLNNTKDMNVADSVLTDSQFVQSRCRIEFFHKNDWYKYYGYSAKFYYLDRQGSPLNNHFLKVIEVKQKRADKEDFEKFKKDKVRGVQTEFEDEYKKALNVIKGYTKLRVMESKQGRSYLGVALPDPQFLILMKTDVTKNSPNLVKEIEPSGSLKEILEYNKRICKEYRMKMYMELVSCLINGLISLGNKYPLLVKEILTEFDRAIHVPDTLNELNMQLPIPLEGHKWIDSVANTCALLGVITIANFKQTGKEVWMGCIS